MKNNFLLLTTLAFLAFSCKKSESTSEKTLTLQLGPVEGQSTYVNYSDSDPNWANSVNYNNINVRQELPIASSTNSGSVIKSRAYFSFNLSQIPSKAEIVSAKLSLYGMPSYFTIPQGNLGDNTFYIQRVIDNWSQTSITWNNQPSTTGEGQITIPGTATRYNFDVTDIDVTALVKAMKSLTSEKTAGFCLKLKNEVPTNTIVFASGRSDDPTKRPKLVVVYSN
jgi:hypothetical protein